MRAKHLSTSSRPFVQSLVGLAILTGASTTSSGCGGSTGNAYVTFHAAGAGPADASPASGPLSFVSDVGWSVTLTKATLHVGGLYLDQTVPLSGRPEGGCYLPGIYVAEVREGLDVDLLTSTPQPFPADGDGTETEAHAGEVWLTGGAVDASDDPTVILDAEGSATRAATTVPFAAAITIGANRQVPSNDPTMPSAHPLCLERIVSPIVVDLTPAQGRTLLLRTDPRALFDTVDFSSLPAPASAGATYQFANAATDNADISLYEALHATTGLYTLTFE